MCWCPGARVVSWRSGGFHGLDMVRWQAGGDGLMESSFGCLSLGQFAGQTDSQKDRESDCEVDPQTEAKTKKQIDGQEGQLPRQMKCTGR